MNISVAKSYVDKNTNATKTKWINIGSLIIGDDGKVFGEIESIPVGLTELKFNCFDRDENRTNPNPPLQQHGQQQTYNAPHGQVQIHHEQAPQQQQQYPNSQRR